MLKIILKIISVLIMLLGVYLLFFTANEGIGVIVAIIGFVLYPTSGRTLGKKGARATSSHGSTHNVDDDDDNDDGGGSDDSGGGGDD